MKAVVVRGVGRSKLFAGCRLRLGTFIGLCACAASAFALDDGPAGWLAQSATPNARERAQLEVSTSSLPRFDNVDSRSSHLDMTWLPPRRSALGLSLGMTSFDTPGVPALGPRPPSSTSLDLGVHWRYTLDGNYRLDVSAWRRVLPPDALTLVELREPSYGARVEMQLGGGAPRSGFVADRGFLGFQLESGARVTLRRSGGKPMVYYRTKF